MTRPEFDFKPGRQVVEVVSGRVIFVGLAGSAAHARALLEEREGTAFCAERPPLRPEEV